MAERRPTAVLAEDEPLLRAQLRELLAAVWPELEVLAEAEDGFQAISALQEHQPDVLFLDIQMPGITGLEVARHASGRHHVVFVTAHDEHALAAFEEGAVDYLMKPLSAARLATACARLKKRLTLAPPDLQRLLDALAERAPQARTHLRWINASSGSEVKLITVDEICYFQSDTKYTRAVTAGSESLIRKSLRELLEELDPESFWQIHRSTVVNVNAIAGVSRDFAGRLFVRLKARKETLPVSQPFAHLFRQM
ncbi:MAG TPA: LytTR family DNA-binding domain-containing protein [Burkholderiales bacterium]|nr:LytTR family DNA-binding domain-containing protein [Burkholderiales bacterium]